MKLVNPANKRKYTVIVVGSGLAGGAAAAIARPSSATTSSASASRTARAARTSIAAQGGINAAKNYQNDGDSVYRLFYDTVKGGDFRAREANVYRLAEVSVNIIDQCVAQGVPFAREYGGLLDNRSFGGAQVSRTFYARGQTGQQLLLGAYQALERQIGAGTVEMYTAHRDARPRRRRRPRARHRRARPGHRRDRVATSADAVVLATGGYGNVFYLSTNAKGCNVTATWRAHKRGALLRQPLLHADPPDLHPGQRRLPVEAHADERVAAQRRPRLGAEEAGRQALAPTQIPEAERDYYLERKYPSFGNLVPRDIASRAAKAGLRRGPRRRPRRPRRLPRLRRRHQARSASDTIARALRQPLRHVRAHHRRGPVRGADAHLPGRPLHDGRPVGRLQPDEHHPRPVRARRGELLRPRRQPPRRQRADAGPGRRLLRPARTRSATTSPAQKPGAVDDRPRRRSARPRRERRRAASSSCSAIKGKRTVDSFHRELGTIMWDNCGMARSEEGLTDALEQHPGAARASSGRTCSVPGSGDDAEPERSRRPGRVADFLELGELMCARRARTARSRCGGHFREESQTPEGEAKRDDENFAYVAAWEYTGDEHSAPVLHKEPLEFENVQPAPAELQVSELNLTLHVWRQTGPQGRGQVRHATSVNDVSRAHVVPRDARRRSTSSSIAKGEEPIAFDHDCREGICGIVRLHDQRRRARPAARHHRLPAAHAHFKDGDELVDRAVARARPSRCMQGSRRRPRRVRPHHRGGRLHLGRAPAARPTATRSRCRRTTPTCAMDAAACIGCGACVAACPNASAMLFTGAKVAHLGLLAAGPARARRAACSHMVGQMDAEGFGDCTNIGECKPAARRRSRSTSSRAEPRPPDRRGESGQEPHQVTGPPSPD